MAENIKFDEFSDLKTIDEVNFLEKTLKDQKKWDDLFILQASLQRAKILHTQSKEQQPSTSHFKERNSSDGVVFEGKYVNLIQIKNIFVKKFNTKGRDFRLQFKEDYFKSPIAQALLILYDSFEEILSFIFAGLSPTTFARFIILSDQFETPVSVKFQPITNITPDVIFTELEKVIVSKKKFLIDSNLRIHILTCAPPAGSGPGKNKRSFCFPIDKKKRSFKRICNGLDDFLCLSRAIILGTYLVDFPNPNSKERSYALAGRNQNELFEKQKLLHQKAGLKIEKRPYSLQDVDMFQKVFAGKYRIYVFETQPTFQCLYKGTLAPENSNIFLHLDSNHYDILTSVDKYLPPHKFFCTVCCETYTSGSELTHKGCKNLCSACFHPNCSYVLDNEIQKQNWVKCLECHRFWNQRDCYGNHKKIPFGKKMSVCDLFVKCLNCFSIIERCCVDSGTHVCNETYCRTCRIKYVKSTEKHVCFIKPKKSKFEREKFKSTSHFVNNVIAQSKRKHYYYDIESEVINGCHEPILLVMHDSYGNENRFFGKDCIDKFFTEIFTKEYKNAIFISHGGRSYDHYFGLNYCYKKNILPNTLFTGSQILKMEMEQYKITFKDNLCFLARPLADLPKTMGLDIEISKGFFPYKLKFPYTDRLVIDLPDKDLFCAETMNVERRKEFDVWYEKRLKEAPKFDYFVELATYCSQDVRILRLAATKFRRLILDLGEVDPYEECLTLAHVCSEVFKKRFMSPETIAIIPHSGVKYKKCFSIKSIKYFEYLMHTKNIYIRHQLNGGEVEVMGKFFADGFEQFKQATDVVYERKNIKGIIYEFGGCFFHGHASHYNSTDLNPLNGKTFGDLYNNFTEKIHLLQENNYIVRVIWECEYDLQYKMSEKLRNFVDNLEIVGKLQPGDGLYGGRNEVFSLFRETNNEEEINLADVDSLYPFVMCSKKFPIGPPTEIKIHPEITDMSTFFGVAVVKVLPPKNLALPVLPFRQKKGEKIFYILCKTCCIEKNCYNCFHNEEEKAFIGTYTSFEIQLAIEKGYKFLKCFEMWHWTEENTSKDLFRDYIKTFYKVKIANKGFPKECDTAEEKQSYCRKINEENDIDLNVSDFQNNPGMKNTAKYLINSLWGKLAIKPGKCQTKFINDPADYFQMVFNNPFIEIDDVMMVSEEMVCISYKEIDKLPSSFTNVVLASMVTSYARCWLYSLMDKLHPSQLNYADTDSVNYITAPGLPYLELGCKLGSLTDDIVDNFQVKDCVQTWVATGNKSYAYNLKKNPELSMVKVKGFTLNLACNAIDVDFKQMVDIILLHPSTTIDVEQRPLFVKDKKHAEIYTKRRFKKFKFQYDNKVILRNFQTRPYGFIGSYPSFENFKMSLNSE